MGFVIFLIPARNRPLLMPAKKRRDKEKEPTKTYSMSKGYKGISQTNVFLFGCFWIIESIEMSGHISIITPFIMVWPYYGLLFSTLNIG
jgi:hypothetical protein